MQIKSTDIVGGGGGGPGGPAEIETISDASTDLANSQASKYLRFTNTSAKSLTVRPNAIEAMDLNAEWIIYNEGINNLTIVEGSGVAITPPPNGTLVIPPKGTVTLKRVSVDVYDLIGKTLEAAQLVTIATVGGSYTADGTEGYTIFSDSSAMTITLPTGVPVGSQFSGHRGGTGTVTFAAGSGANIRSPGGLLALRAQYSAFTATKISSTDWALAGDLT